MARISKEKVLIIAGNTFVEDDFIKESGLDVVLLVIDQEYPEIISDERNFEKLLQKFIKGYNNRPSVRTGNASKTLADPIVDHIIKARIHNFTEEQIGFIGFSHRLSMAAENLLGLMLEEYIHTKVHGKGWACCWGNSVRYVDFCSVNGDLLQIKNRSNTENSSSNKIRNGTIIKKWYRINAHTGKYYWNKLNDIIKVDTKFSEEEFREYCYELLSSNPDVLFIDSEDAILKGF